MDEPLVEFVGKELGQHGSNVYFKEFSVTINGEKRNYKLGEFYFMRKEPRQPICIAEFQLIWMNLKDSRKLAAAKLYFRPEDTKSGRLCEHGEDELMEADRFVPVYCEQVPSWEYNLRVPFGKCAYEGVSSGDDYLTNHKESPAPGNCCCKQNDSKTDCEMRTQVKVLSFPAYCRYRASLKLISVRRGLPRNVMVARGAIEVDCPKTKILFNRYKFQHDDIDSFALAENIRIPVFKGRPRKRKQSKTKFPNEGKKSKLEKENSNPDVKGKIDFFAKEDLKTGNNQTYRIIAPPGNSNPNRNVIHVKIENKSELTNFEDLQGENNLKSVIKLNNGFQENFVENESRLYDGNGDDDEDYEDDINFEDSKIDGSKTSDEECQNELRRTRSLKKEDSVEIPPSELVKNGKTGTILDEAFFRELKNGMKSAEGVDKEKMKKILVDACQDQEKFKRDLFIFMKQRGTPIVYVPKVGYTRVDLPKLFSLVVANGGYRQVTLNHKWKKVYDEMALATTITSAATCMRRHYEKLLLPFEKYLRVKHKQDALANRTYSITAQASQPLVLTIKKIKKEHLASPSASPERTDISRLPAMDIEEKVDAMHANGNYRPLSIEKEPFVKTESCYSNNDASDDACSTPTSCAVVHSAAKENQKPHAQLTNQSENQVNDVQSKAIGTVTSQLRPIQSKSAALGSQCSVSSQATLNPVNAVPVGMIPSSESSMACSKPYISISSASFKTNQNASSEMPDTPSSVIPIIHAPILNATAATKNVARKPAILVPVVSRIQTTKIPVPSTTLNSLASQAIVVYPSHAKEFTVITKARSFHNETIVQSMAPIHTASLQSQNPPVVKKRRGRPPKHLKSQLQPSTAPMQNIGSQNLCKVTIKNSTVLQSDAIHAMEVPSSSIYSIGVLGSFQSVCTTPSVKGTLMSAVENRRKGPVKMYEYVRTSDTTNVKLVKHKQGVIFPDGSEPKEMKISKSPVTSNSQISPVSYMKAADYGCLLPAPNMNGDKSYPRVETVMSFASKGCLPSTLLCKSDIKSKPVTISSVIEQSDIKPFKEHVVAVESEVEYKLHALQQEKDMETHCRSVIVGPPPLVPIQKQGKTNEQNCVTSFSVVKKGDTPQKYKSTPPKKGGTPAKRESPQISFMSDMRALKESFDVDKIIKPLTKTIDQSLEDLRKVTGKSSDRNSNHPHGTQDRTEFYGTNSEREAEIREMRVLNRAALYSKHQAVLDHKELKVDIDRIHVDVAYGHESHHKTPDSTKYQEYLIENDASQRLLRIASNDDFSGQISRESTNMQHPSVLKRDHPGHNNGAERGRRSHSMLQERPSFDAYEQRSKKVKLTDEYLKYQETLYRSDEGIPIVEHRYPASSPRSQSQISHHSHVIREQGHESRLHREAHHHGDTHHQRLHLREHVGHSFYHDHHRIDHLHSDRHQTDHRPGDHHHSDHHLTDHHHSDHHKGDQHHHDHHRTDHHRADQHHHADRRHSEHQADRHHNGHQFPAESPKKEFSTLHYDLHASEHRSGRHLVAYQADAAHIDYHHHNFNAMYQGRSSSPTYEHKHLVMIDHSPPPSTIHHSWYSHHRLPVIGKDGHNPMFWHQQVHH